MSLWKNADAANSAPKYNVEAGTTATGNTAYGNVTVGAIKSGAAIGVFGVDPTEASLNKKVTHPGWVIVRQGTGFVSSLALANGGTGYANSDLVRVSGGTINAAGTLVTNSTGGITSVTLGTQKGSGFVSTTTVAVTNSTGGSSGGSNAVITATLGGRAGRIHMETLVAMGSMTGDGSDDTVFPDS